MARVSCHRREKQLPAAHLILRQRGARGHEVLGHGIRRNRQQLRRGLHRVRQSAQPRREGGRGGARRLQAAGSRLDAVAIASLMAMGGNEPAAAQNNGVLKTRDCQLPLDLLCSTFMTNSQLFSDPSMLS